MGTAIILWMLSGQLLWNIYMTRPEGKGGKDWADDVAFLWMCYILGPIQWAVLAHLVSEDIRDGRDVR